MWNMEIENILWRSHARSQDSYTIWDNMAELQRNLYATCKDGMSFEMHTLYSLCETERWLKQELNSSKANKQTDG